MAKCTFKVGETILVGIECAGATDDLLIGATCTAVLKAAIETVDGFTVPPSNAAVVATFTPLVRGISADVGPGWDLSIDPVTSAAIAPGTYVTNGVLTLASGLVTKLAPLFITLTQATS